MDRTVTLSKHETVVDKYDYKLLVQEVKELRKLVKKIPTNKKLRDIAYKIATGAVTTRTMTEKQWEKCNTSNVLWEPFDGYGNDFTESLVSEIASSVINQLSIKEIK